MTDTRYLVHGVFWDGAPATDGRARRRQPGSAPAVTGTVTSARSASTPGTRLGFRRRRRRQVLPGAPQGALGHQPGPRPVRRPAPRRPRATSANGASWWTIPGSSTTSTGAAASRTGCARYLMQRALALCGHVRRRRQQGGHGVGPQEMEPARGTGGRGGQVRCARAQDGRVVRILEDMVTREAGLVAAGPLRRQGRSPRRPVARGRGWSAIKRGTRRVSARLLARAAVEGFERGGRALGAARRRRPRSAVRRCATRIRTRSTTAPTASPSLR